MASVALLAVVCAQSDVGGYVILCSTDTESFELMQLQLANEPLLHLEFKFVRCGDKGRSHNPAVTQDHAKALRSCATRAISPCLILEGDAQWFGSLGTAITLAMEELANDDWDVLTAGIAATDIKRQVNTQTKRAKKHTLRLDATGGGCHAYVARYPATLARQMVKKQQSSYGKPCIEFFANEVNIRLLIHFLVLQRSKSFREGLPWHVDTQENIRLLECGFRTFVYNLFRLTFNFCSYS